MGQRESLAVALRMATIPINVPLYPGPEVYGVGLLLSLVSGLLFGAVPMKQVLRADPYQIHQIGIAGQRRAADYRS